MKGKRDRGLLAIALFKWFKGALLLLLGFGCLKLLHRDVAGVFEGLADQLRVDPDNRYLGALLSKLRLLDDRKIEALSALTFVYSAVFFVEGTGLFLEKRWAEYLTIFTTGSLVPVEVYELVKEFSWMKSITLLINVAIVVVLIIKVRRPVTK
jgi:uncharacterized membrane protein (DUF2068 family)